MDNYLESSVERRFQNKPDVGIRSWSEETIIEIQPDSGNFLRIPCRDPLGLPFTQKVNERRYDTFQYPFSFVVISAGCRG